MTVETGIEWGREDPTMRCRSAGGTAEHAWGIFQMVMWPALTLIGFVLLTALVVAMGMQSTARYEREQRRDVRATAPRQSAAEPVGATTA